MDPVPDDFADYAADADRPRLPRINGVTAGLAALLLLLGLALLGLWRVLDGNERLPFADGAAPPAYVRVTVGQTYQIAVPGGVRAMLARGFAVSQNGTIALDCQYTPRGSVGFSPLELTAESSDTKAETTVGEFVGPVTGDIRVTCSGWGAVFVPNSDDRPSDHAGLALLGSIILLTAGAALGLSQLRASTLRVVPARETEDDGTKAGGTKAGE